MRLPIATTVLFLSACYQPPDLTAYGVEIWQGGTQALPPTHDIAATIRAALAYDGTPRGLFTAEPLLVTFVDGPLPCPPSVDADRCADLVWADRAEVLLNTPCLADTALVHGLMHAIRDRTRHDRDDSHHDAPLWRFANVLAPQGLRARLAGCN